MVVYLVTIFLTIVLGILANDARKVRVNQNTKKEYYMGTFFVFLIFLIWAMVFACRGINVGTDTSGYKYFYDRIILNNVSLEAFMLNQRDWLFGYLEYFCCRIFKGNWICFQFVVAILLYAPVLVVLKKRADYLMSSLLLFIFTLNFFSGFNGMRQAVAVSIVFYAYYECFTEKQYFKYAFLLFLAFGFHSSVILAIPVHFLSRFKVKGRVVSFSVCLVILLYLFMWQVWPVIINFLEAIGQSKMAADYAEVAKDAGSGLTRFAVALVPVFVGNLYKERLEEKFQHINNELVLCLFGALFMLLSTKYWIFARVSAYFLSTQIMFIPKLYEIFTENSRKTGCFMILILYSVYMIMLLLHGEGGYYPYSFIF